LERFPEHTPDAKLIARQNMLQNTLLHVSSTPAKTQLAELSISTSRNAPS
jgi:hypothetical protein